MTAAERCCRECRSSFPDVCRAKRDCFCHLEQQAIARQQDKHGTPPRRDPTANKAIGNITRQQRRKRKER